MLRSLVGIYELFIVIFVVESISAGGDPAAKRQCVSELAADQPAADSELSDMDD